MVDHKDCDCGCNHEEEPVIYVQFENEEEETACDVVGIFEVEDTEYIALVPQDTEDDILLYRFEEDEDELNLKEIETDEEYEKVATEFEKLYFEEEIQE